MCLSRASFFLNAAMCVDMYWKCFDRLFIIAWIFLVSSIKILFSFLKKRYIVWRRRNREISCFIFFFFNFLVFPFHAHDLTINDSFYKTATICILNLLKSDGLFLSFWHHPDWNRFSFTECFSAFKIWSQTASPPMWKPKKKKILFFFYI